MLKIYQRLLFGLLKKVKQTGILDAGFYNFLDVMTSEVKAKNLTRREANKDKSNLGLLLDEWFINDVQKPEAKS